MILLRDKTFSIKHLKNNIAFNRGLEELKKKGGMKAVDGMSPKKFTKDILKSGREAIKKDLGITGVNKSINEKANASKMTVKKAKKIMKENNSKPILEFA